MGTRNRLMGPPQGAQMVGCIEGDRKVRYKGWMDTE